MKELTEEHFAILRRHMAEMIVINVELASDELGKEALDERVIAALGRVPRHCFVPGPLAAYAYHDRPIPIGFDTGICPLSRWLPVPSTRIARSAWTRDAGAKPARSAASSPTLG